MRLAAFAKGRIKYEDFTSKDKFNILDLFVNNEKTLVKIYEALFPHRAVAKGLSNNANSVSGGIDKSTGRYGYLSGVASPIEQSQYLQYQFPTGKAGTHANSQSGYVMVNSLNTTVKKNDMQVTAKFGKKSGMTAITSDSTAIEGIVGSQMMT